MLLPRRSSCPVFGVQADVQIKPLTEEEKKAKLAELREKLAAKRAMQSKEDEKAARANEAIRRKAGQDMGRVREDMAVKEAQRDAERKRQGESTGAQAGHISCSYKSNPSAGKCPACSLSVLSVLQATTTVALCSN